jgi:hypothetical protein
MDEGQPRRLDQLGVSRESLGTRPNILETKNSRISQHICSTMNQQLHQGPDGYEKGGNGVNPNESC